MNSEIQIIIVRTAHLFALTAKNAYRVTVSIMMKMTGVRIVKCVFSVLKGMICTALVATPAVQRTNLVKSVSIVWNVE